MLSSSSKSRIFLYNAHLALFVRMDDTITRTKVTSFSKFSELELALEIRASTVASQAELLQNWGRMRGVLLEKRFELREDVTQF